MKKALVYCSVILSIFSCVEKEEVNIPKELVGKWEREIETPETGPTQHTFVFKSNGTYESFGVRNIPTEELQSGYLGYSTGNYSEIDGKLLLSNTRSFYAEDNANPPSEIGLLKEQLEWVIFDRVAEFSLQENGNMLSLTFLGCDDVPTPRARMSNCAPPSPILYDRAVE